MCDHALSWADEKFGCSQCGRRRGPVTRLRHGMKGDCSDYREDLARFPKDPEAYTDGPRAVQKLLDKRLRQGWRIREEGFQENPSVKHLSGDEVAREAYRRAEAKGFVPDDE